MTIKRRSQTLRSSFQEQKKEVGENERQPCHRDPFLFYASMAEANANCAKLECERVSKDVCATKQESTTTLSH